MTYLDFVIDAYVDKMIFEDWPANFRVTWVNDFDAGWQAEATWHQAKLGDMALDRPDAVKVLGTEQVKQIEWDAGEFFTINWRDFVREEVA